MIVEGGGMDLCVFLQSGADQWSNGGTEIKCLDNEASGVLKQTNKLLKDEKKKKILQS